MENHKILIVEDQNIRLSRVMNSAVNHLGTILKQHEFAINFQPSAK